MITLENISKIIGHKKTKKELKDEKKAVKRRKTK